MYTVTPTVIADVLVLEPKVFGDSRGLFLESFNARAFSHATGLEVNFVQDNHSRSKKGVLRGLHFQVDHPQGKLVRVTQGEVFDVVVDIRRDSPTYGQWVGETLTGVNHKQMWVPPGLAHGFLVLSETADFLYKTTDYYHPESERTVLWSDPEIGIEWPAIAPLTLATKDQAGLPLAAFL